jgi:hypothetical protein
MPINTHNLSSCNRFNVRISLSLSHCTFLLRWIATNLFNNVTLLQSAYDWCVTLRTYAIWPGIYLTGYINLISSCSFLLKQDGGSWFVHRIKSINYKESSFTTLGVFTSHCNVLWVILLDILILVRQHQFHSSNMPLKTGEDFLLVVKWHR